MTAPQHETIAALGDRWRSPLAGHRFDTTAQIRRDEGRAIGELGVGNLRRLKDHDRSATGWTVIGRLLRPLEAVNAGLDGPVTPHRHRAMLDVAALLLLRCADHGQTFWSWTDQEWVFLLGRDHAEFRRHAPAWAGDEVRPYLAAHAYLLGSFTGFDRLGNFQRLTLARRIFGRDRLSSEISRARVVLAEWGYRLGNDDDKLLPMVACRLFLLNRSPHLDDLETELFDRARRDRLLPATQMNTLHALQRAVSALGFCDPPRQGTGRRSTRASGGAPEWNGGWTAGTRPRR
ncbi:hypothetical protein [Actinomadura macra]|uniref:hypothetical protein n=1 Tax=Actinomadura macra TaxID=46164 RepID=UPI000833196E|nr:hypothetical protein [Actinomadura macra]